MKLTIPRYSTTFFHDDGIEIEVPNGGQPDARKLVYDAERLKVYNKNLGFLADARFQRAYQRGVTAELSRGAPDPHLQYRVYINSWAATLGARLEGDLVECGVNMGMTSLAVCDYVDLNATGKRFFLFDTFAGGPPGQAHAREQWLLQARQNAYPNSYEAVKANFAAYPGATLVRGGVPESLSSTAVERVCYLSIDMEFAEPELAAMEFFWPKLSIGAPVILAGYAWAGYEETKQAMDDFARRQGTEILTLPTGQGFVIKT